MADAFTHTDLQAFMKAHGIPSARALAIRLGISRGTANGMVNGTGEIGLMARLALAAIAYGLGPETRTNHDDGPDSDDFDPFGPEGQA